MGDPAHPSSVFSYGGRFAWNDAGETPNMQNSMFTWENQVPLMFEVRNLWVDPETNAAENFKGRRMGVIVSCEGGELRCGRGGGIGYDADGKRIRSFKGDRGLQHIPAFVKAVRSRKQSDVACSLQDGYLSSCLAHLANASYLSGRNVDGSVVQKRVSKDPILKESHGRLSAHLARWKSSEAWTLGQSLRFHSEKERFVSGDQSNRANKLLRREYRPGFEVPENV